MLQTDPVIWKTRQGSIAQQSCRHLGRKKSTLAPKSDSLKRSGLGAVRCSANSLLWKKVSGVPSVLGFIEAIVGDQRLISKLSPRSTRQISFCGSQKKNLFKELDKFCKMSNCLLQKRIFWIDKSPTSVHFTTQYCIFCDRKPKFSTDQYMFTNENVFSRLKSDYLLRNLWKLIDFFKH